MRNRFLKIGFSLVASAALLTGCGGYTGVASSKDVQSSITQSQPDSALAMTKYGNASLGAVSAIDTLIVSMTQPQNTPTSSQYQSLMEKSQTALTTVGKQERYLNQLHEAAALSDKKEALMNAHDDLKTSLKLIIKACSSQSKSSLQTAYSTYSAAVSSVQAASTGLQ